MLPPLSYLTTPPEVPEESLPVYEWEDTAVEPVTISAEEINAVARLLWEDSYKGKLPPSVIVRATRMWLVGAAFDWTENPVDAAFGPHGGFRTALRRCM